MRLRDKGEDGCMELMTKGEQNRGQIAKHWRQPCISLREQSKEQLHVFICSQVGPEWDHNQCRKQ